MVPHQVPGGSERTLYVLAVLARHGEPLSVAELAAKTGLAPSTLYRQLALLKRWGFESREELLHEVGELSCLERLHRHGDAGSGHGAHSPARRTVAHSP